MPCSCCAGESLDIFGEKAARRALRRYLRKGLGGSDATQIADVGGEGGLDGATVMEVGGGIGQIQAELVRRGAAHGTVVEVVDGYEEAARELAAAVGIADRSSFVLADLVETPDAVEPADIVVLRRVVCCTPVGPVRPRRCRGSRAPHAARELSARPDRHPCRRPPPERRPRADAEAVSRVRPPARRSSSGPRRERGLVLARVSRGVVWETAQFDAAS